MRHRVPSRCCVDWFDAMGRKRCVRPFPGPAPSFVNGRPIPSGARTRAPAAAWSDAVIAKTKLGRTALVAALCLGMSSDAAAAAWRCSARPVEPCAKQHGRLSSQNGRALLIWLIGTTRVVGLTNGVEELPSPVRRYLDMTSPDYSYIYGDFDICPSEPDRPGHMRTVCVAGAEKLVVQTLRRPRPPFRLLSTWPANDAAPSTNGASAPTGGF